MAAAALTATFLAQVRGGDAGDKDVKATWSVPTPKEDTQSVTLTQNTTTTVTIPSGTVVVVIYPPADNTQAIRFDDASGRKIGKAVPTVFDPDGDTSFVLHLAAGSNQTVKVVAL